MIRHNCAMRIDHFCMPTLVEDGLSPNAREGGMDAVHVTIAYHENFREVVVLKSGTATLNGFPDLIVQAMMRPLSMQQGIWPYEQSYLVRRTQPSEDDIGLVEVYIGLVCVFMQLI
jgi:hypothetical protein